MKTRWGVLISGNGSTLQAVLDCHDLIDVSVVISSRPKAYGIQRARRAGIPVEVIPKFETKKESEEWILKTLNKYRVQFVFLAGFMRIVSEQIINQFHGKIFNVHPSLLPKYKGLDSFNEALAAGDLSGGVTVHHVAVDVDSGNHVLQNEFQVPNHRDTDLSHLWLHINEQRVIRESMRKLLWAR